MPNHCTNKLSLGSLNTGKTLGELLKPYLTKCKGDNLECLDFDKILPMPDGIRKTHDVSSIEEITKFQHGTPEYEARQKEQELIQEENVKLYGSSSWYDWSVSKWGTKWNSYNSYYDDSCKIEEIDYFEFQTAWSPPFPVIKELSKLIGESLRMSYYDEGWLFGGVYNVKPDGTEDDICYEDPRDVDEDDPLYEELDCEYQCEVRADMEVGEDAIEEVPFEDEEDEDEEDK